MYFRRLFFLTSSKNTFTAFLLFSMLSFFGCSPKNTGSSSVDAMAAAEKLAQEKIGGEFDCQTNESETYLLCKSRVDAVNPQGAVIFFIYNLTDQQVVYEDKFPKGSVEWATDSRIKIQETPGLLKKDESLEDYAYMYDVIQKTRINHD